MSGYTPCPIVLLLEIGTAAPLLIPSKMMVEKAEVRMVR